MLMPTRSRYVNACVRMLFDDEHFLNHDGYLPSFVNSGRMRLMRRQHFFAPSTSQRDRIFRRYELSFSTRWRSIFSLMSVPRADADMAQGDMTFLLPYVVGQSAYVLYRLHVNNAEAWKNDIFELSMFNLVDFSKLPRTR